MEPSLGLLKLFWTSWFILVASWAALDACKAAKLAQYGAHTALRHLRDGTRWSHGGPKAAPRRPTTRPRRPTDVPRRSQNAPAIPQHSSSPNPDLDVGALRVLFWNHLGRFRYINYYLIQHFFDVSRPRLGSIQETILEHSGYDIGIPTTIFLSTLSTFRMLFYSIQADF